MRINLISLSSFLFNINRNVLSMYWTGSYSLFYTTWWTVLWVKLLFKGTWSKMYPKIRFMFYFQDLWSKDWQHNISNLYRSETFISIFEHKTLVCEKGVLFYYHLEKKYIKKYNLINNNFVLQASLHKSWIRFLSQIIKY